MTSEQSAVTRAAEVLIEALRSGVPTAPVRELIGSADVDAAYAVQKIVVEDQLRAGAERVGRKIGLTSPPVQKQLGVDRPDFGVLLDTMQVEGSCPLESMIAPKVEAELAFILTRDLDQGPFTAESVKEAVGEVCAALEIVDSRVTNWDITFGDTVADNASSAKFVLGTQRRSLDEVTPKSVTMTMRVNGEHASEGSGAACLGDPLEAVAWLARTAHELGDPLRAGEVVLSGALGPMAAITEPCTVTAQVSGFDDVSVAFTRGGQEGSHA